MVDLSKGHLETGAGLLYKPQGWGVQIPLVIAAFIGGPAIGWLIGGMMPGLSEGARTFLCVPFVLMFFLGYGLWLARLNAIAFHGLGKGLLKALFLLLVLRRKPARLEDVLPSRDKLAEMLVRGQRAASSFLAVSVPIAIVAGLVVMFFETGTSLLLREILVVGGYVGWGWLLSFLGRRGYLPFPEDAS
ncbi:MAG: hypothetical protein ACREEV_18195 [Dongiaceae bacterium]